MTTTTNESQGWHELLSNTVLPKLGVVLFGIWLHAASSLIAATTLPRAVPQIGGAHLVGWAFSLYQLGSILAGVACGLIVARYGLRNALMIAGSLYFGGCIASATSVDMVMMLVGRTFQGVGGGAIMAAAYIALNRLFPKALQSRLIALASAIWIISAFLGPLVGGAFANVGLWRLAFWVFAVQSVVFVGATRLLIAQVPRSQISSTRGCADGNNGDQSNDAQGDRVDITFTFGRLLVLALAILFVAVAGAEVHLIYSPLFCLIGGALFVWFLVLDGASHGHSLFPRRPFHLGTDLGAGLLFVLSASLSTMSLLVYGPFVLMSIYGVSPLTAGYIVAIESVAWGIAAVAVGGIAPASERRCIRIGSVLITAGIAGLAMFVPKGPLWLVVPFAACPGIGFGMMWAFVVRRIIFAALDRHRDTASSAIPATQQIGFAFGASLASIVANSVGFSAQLDVATAARVGFWIFAAFVPLALLANVAAWRLSK